MQSQSFWLQKYRIFVTKIRSNNYIKEASIICARQFEYIIDLLVPIFHMANLHVQDTRKGVINKRVSYHNNSLSCCGCASWRTKPRTVLRFGCEANVVSLSRGSFAGIGMVQAECRSDFYRRSPRREESRVFCRSLKLDPRKTERLKKPQVVETPSQLLWQEAEWLTLAGLNIKTLVFLTGEI